MQMYQMYLTYVFSSITFLLQMFQYILSAGIC